MSGSASTDGALRPDRELLTAWLLLFLAHGSGYGYGLAEQLREQGLDLEMTIVYRVLRGLEADGRVTSRWIESSVGPRRRLYSLTAKGRRTLDGLAAVVIEQRDRYARFVQSYARASRRGTQRVAAGSHHHAIGPHPEKELLTAWTLLLLDGDASYGYELRKQLAGHDIKGDPGQVYRLLRRLEGDGDVRSRWSDPILGPRRRVYRVTAQGRRTLQELAEAIMHSRNVHEAFAEAYVHLDDDFRGPAIAERAAGSTPDSEAAQTDAQPRNAA